MKKKKKVIGLSEQKKERWNETKILIITAGISAAMIVAGIFMGDPGILGNLIIMSIFITAVPYFFFKYSKYMWVKSLELEFPNFVRDLADAIRSMPLPEALGIVSKSNYGNLSDEVRSIYHRMSWGTPFLRAIEIFEGKVRSSKTITESLEILKESYTSGGNMVSTLESIARDLLTLREADQERSSMLRQHIMVMYAIFFMFLGISLMIIFVMVPMLETQSGLRTDDFGFGEAFSFSNPCYEETIITLPGGATDAVYDIKDPIFCGFYSGVSLSFGLEPTSIGSYYVSLFFVSLIIQGICVGLITGQLGENSVTAGIKHSIIMVVVSVSVFLFISKLGLF